jgi:hypothetical protein
VLLHLKRGWIRTLSPLLRAEMFVAPPLLQFDSLATSYQLALGGP